jgi:hypothetical protein
MASSNLEYSQMSFKIYCIFHICHAPKLEFAYNVREFYFWSYSVLGFRAILNKPNFLAILAVVFNGSCH